MDRLLRGSISSSLKRSRGRSALLVAAALLLSLVPQIGSQADAFGSASPDYDRLDPCGAPRPPNELHAERGFEQSPPDGYSPVDEWLFAPGVQAAIRGPQLALEGKPAFVGSYLDYELEKLVIVIDESVAASSAIDYVHVHADISTGDPVTAKPSCRPASEIEEQRARLLEVVHGFPEVDNASVRIDPATTDPTLYVDSLRPGNETAKRSPDDLENQLAAAMESEVPPVGLVVDSTFSGNRRADVPTHWGGAGVRPRGAVPTDFNNNHCSAAFPMQRPDGGWWMATAKHCRDSEPPGGTEFYDSGPGYYGVKRYISLNTDLMLLGSSNRLYSRRFWTDPLDLPDRWFRAINGKLNNPTVGQGVCVSGMRSQGLCGGVIFDVDQSGSWRLGYAIRSGGDIGCPGDSGGPVFGRTGASNASARGMILGPAVPGVQGCHHTLRFLTVSGMENALLGTTIATSGNARTS